MNVMWCWWWLFKNIIVMSINTEKWKLLLFTTLIYTVVRLHYQCKKQNLSLFVSLLHFFLAFFTKTPQSTQHFLVARWFSTTSTSKSVTYRRESSITSHNALYIFSLLCVIIMEWNIRHCQRVELRSHIHNIRSYIVYILLYVPVESIHHTQIILFQYKIF